MRNFWEKTGWERDDKHLNMMRQMPFHREFPKIQLGPGLYSIRGPRQIGKSSWLKTMLASLPPQQSFFLSCENLMDHKDLAQVLHSSEDRQFIFLDEVTFVKEWWRAVKHHIDRFGNVTIVVTGSHALDLRSGFDRMPGRWAANGEIELLPMDFFEFQKMREQARWPRLQRADELELYFKVGGFPTSLLESGPEGKDPILARETYRRWLLGDLEKIGKQEQYLKELVFQLAETMGSTLSLQKLAQRTQIGSHNTAQDYVEVLESCFAMKTLFNLDYSTGRPRFRKEKKFYFRDPLLYWIAYEWVGLPAPPNANEKLAEMVAHEFLCRREKNFGYYQDRKGEIDFYQHQKWAIEVKWQKIVQGLSATYKNLPLLDKKIWSVDNFLL
jgi:uncharacterized protein